VVAVVAPERRGKELSKVFLGLTVAQVLGVPVGSYLGYSVGWQAAFWAVASLSVVVLALLRRFVPAGLPSQVTSLSLLGAALRDPPRLFAAGFTGAFLGSMYVVYTYLAPMLEQTLGFGRDGVTLFLVLFGFGAVAGNLLGGYLNDHIGAYRTLVILCVAQAVLMPSLSLFPVSLPVAGLLVFTWSLAGWSFMAPQQVRLVTLAPHHQNIILALHASFIYLGASVGSAIGGAVLVRFGIGALGAAGGVCAMLTLLQLVVSQRWASAK
jgi:predicted MFS family arabinose efflux permease